MTTMIKTLLALLATALFTSAHAQNLADWRGGWIADLDGVRHIYYIVLRNNQVTGVYCTDCTNPNNLAFIDDGKLSANSLNFSLYHYPATGAAYVETVTGTLQAEQLTLVRARSGAAPITMTLQRAPAWKPLPLSEFRGNRPVTTTERTLPAAAEPVTAASVSGLWLWGTGPGKQYFIFRPHKGGVRGMVCGPCDSVKDMAPLEGITLNGTNFHFEIVHEDNGGDFPKQGPHSNVTDAVVSRNEMHMNVVPSFAAAGFKPIEMTLLGPVKY
jgi:hypothetical protein